MTKIGRVGNIFAGLCMVCLGLIMAMDPDKVYTFLVTLLGITMLLSGVRSMVYYFSMARHMVGGKTVLYRAVLIIDIALFTLSITDVPLIFVVLYLAGIHGFAGFIDIMSAREARQLQAGPWRLKLTSGVVNVVIAVLCIAFLGTSAVAAEIYSLGLIYSGVIRIIQACRRTAMVYIQ